MKALIVSFSVNGVLGDNLRLITNHIIDAGQNLSVLTNTGTGLVSNPNMDVLAVSFDRNNPTDFINPVSYFKILKFIKKNKFDSVLFLSFHPANLFISKLIPAEKAIFYVHDHDPHSGFSKFDYIFLKPQYSYIYNGKVTLLASSNFMKKEILKKHNNLNPDKIRVIYLGLLENLIFPHEDSIEEDIDVLFFGRIEYYKALDVLIDSYRSNKQTYSCVIIGKGNLKDVFGIEKLPNGVTHINDYVPDEELARYIQRAKLVVMPYRDATGTLVIQTAFYYGKPIVATNTGCFPEYMTDGIDGIIVPIENPSELNKAINKLLADRTLRKRMGLNGKKKVEEIFSNKSITAEYIAALKSV
ncbi:glycosyltransferase family 4 protein [Epilithonimonas caeni]|uniref:glycosyltransferase family 4 protein n=1 Tax=Epilithonimonas caeni TaxID=365343 RepID=UPI000489D6B1|nr:glycosyltransferase family 4 protein [Epilithonimonas caeni]